MKRNVQTIINIQNPMIALTIIALATIAAFWPTFQNQLMTGWDDQWQVINSFTSTGFTWNNMQRIFTEIYGKQYSPLDQCLYMLIYLIDGYNPTLFHTTSLVLHIANICLVYYILKEILMNTATPEKQSVWIVFLTTLLFAIHPLQVESVAWMSASKILLCSFFYLWATRFFICFLQLHKFKYYLAVIVFFICSYASKEQAIIFPVWILLLCSFYKVDLKSIHTWKMLFPLFLLSLVFGLVFILNISASYIQTSGEAVAYTWTQRAVFCCYAIIEYLTKWYLPFNLLYLYPFPMAEGEALPLWMLFYPFILTLAVTALWKWIKHWVTLSGIAFFLVHLALVLHIIPIGRAAIVADRYIYLSSIGISFVAVYFFIMAHTTWKIFWQKTTAITAILLLCALGTYTYQRTLVWHSTETLRKELLERTEHKENDTVKT